MTDLFQEEYDIGYRDGESSGGADWYHVLTENTSISDAANTPMKAVTEINALEARVSELEEQIAEMTGLPFSQYEEFRAALEETC